MNNDLYKILEIDYDSSCCCSKEEIRKAYYRLSKKYHPDKNHDDNAHEKFNKIHSAYEILINDNLRNEYIKMNELEKSNFIIILEKILGQEININELNNYGIELNKNDIEYLENNFINFFKRINFIELLDLFKGIINKKEFNNNYSESDIDVYDELCGEYYEQLPIYINIINKSYLDIKIDLNININDIINNNKKKIKIKRKVNNDIITNSFIFYLNKPYIIYYGLGDVDNNNSGNLIIKLNLCINYLINNNNNIENNKTTFIINKIDNSKVDSNLIKIYNNIIWNNNLIVIEENISLYQFINGLDIDIILNNYKLIINNWIPYKNGLLIDINNINQANNNLLYLNNLKINILLNIDFDNSKKNIEILNKYFS
jgi:curved DNA-binding protein CbpA